jgi:lipopolysaccharide transport system permease protein
VVDFMASFSIFLVVLRHYDMPLRWQMLVVVPLLVMTLALTLAVSLWLATLSVKYRDVSFAVAFLLQAIMYVSPVIYPVSLVPPAAQFFYQLNPMSVVIQEFRWALLGLAPASAVSLGLSLGLLTISLISGAYVFRRTERTVVDLL